MVLLALCLWANSVRADGKVFPSIAFPAEVRIPDQSALLVWSNGVERLVIETRFVGEGTNFAWVVPLPSVPKIEPASAGLFPTLRYLFSPELRHRIVPWWSITLTVGALIWLLATVRPESNERLADIPACAVASFGISVVMISGLGQGRWLFGLLLFTALWMTVWRIRRGTEPVYIILLVILLMTLLASLFLPTLGKATAGRGASAEGDVQLLDRKLVGIFETVTLNASNSVALMEWLKENQFAVSPGCEPIIRDYLREGWVFVAAKVQRQNDTRAPVAPHPLSFTFKAAKPVYPLRLTRVGNDSLDVELFVSGTERARIDGFKVTECRRVDRRVEDRVWYLDGFGRMGHPQLLAWAGEAPTFTQLRGTLDSTDMQRDAEVQWEPFRPERTRVYSTTGARTLAANWTVPLFLLFVLGILLKCRRQKLPVRHAVLFGLPGAAGCAILAGIIFAAVAKVEVRMQKMPWAINRMNLSTLAYMSEASLETNQVTDLPAVRAALAQFVKTGNPRHTSNILLGGPIREEDSPGNYTLRQTESGIEFTGYDGTGEGTVIHTFPTNSPGR